MTRRKQDNGAALITVLAVVMLGSVVVTTMALQLNDTAKNLSYAQSSVRAETLLRSLENSVALGLWRDRMTSPEADSLAEDWAKSTIQNTITIDDATIAVTVSDAQARFNVGNFKTDPLGAGAVLESLVEADLIPREVAARIRAAFQAGEAPNDFSALAVKAGLTDSEIDGLIPWVTFLPMRTTVNLNTAPEALVRVLIGGDYTFIKGFLDLRRDKGIVLPNDLATVGLILPPSSSLSTDYITAAVTAVVGPTQLSVSTLFFRPEKSPPIVVQRQR